MRQSTFTIVALLLMISTAMAQSQYKIERDINYRSDNAYSAVQCRLDIATPEQAASNHVIV